MSQQINLFDPGFRKQRELLSAATIAGAVLLMCVATAGYGLYAHSALARTEAQLAKATADLKQITEQLTKVGGLPAPVASKALSEEIDRAEARVGTHQALIDKLKGGGIGTTQGYSGYLAALARQRTDGVWLTGIDIAEGGTEFLIRGRVMRAELLPGYLSMLNREEALRGRLISQMRLSEREQEAPMAVQEPKSEPAAKAGDAAKQTDSPPAPPARPRMRLIDFTIGTGGSVLAAAGQ